ncbi:MAG: hypothetical protein LBB43_04930 [Spirochaetaceae bacterium]|jgi:hypothetical protein|nr:hypothetical protein [Spirochaetaceae bacterium]
MRKRTAVWGILIIALSCGWVLFYRYGSTIQQRRIEEKEARVKELQETLIPLRFKLKERAGDTLTVGFQFYSLAVENIDTVDDMEDLAGGKEIGPLHSFTLEGTELFIDCLKFHNKGFLPVDPDALFVFPYRIFTDLIPPDNGIMIVDLYDEDGFPAIFNSFDLDAQDKERLLQVYQQLKKYGTITDPALQNEISGNALHDMKNISRFRVDRWYDLVVHIKKGSLEFVME